MKQLKSMEMEIRGMERIIIDDVHVVERLGTLMMDTSRLWDIQVGGWKNMDTKFWKFEVSTVPSSYSLILRHAWIHQRRACTITSNDYICLEK